MNKRDDLLRLLDPSLLQEYIPAAFFLHFDPIFHQGQAAVDKHLEYFCDTDMDFVKIQYERTFPHLAEIQRPEDWRKMPLYQKDFYEPQLQVVEGLVKAAKNEALVIITLYSPFMCAGHSASLEMLTRHIHADPQAVQQGMEIITASLMVFVQACIELGVDGFYHSTQGGESGRFSDFALFDACVKPYDLALMEEINRRCSFNILHICDYNGGYDDLTPILDYPGHVVSCPLLLGDQRLELQDVARLFNRPVMGGLDRHGVLVSGGSAAIQEAVQQVLQSAPDRFILGADCTVPSNINWDHLRLAIDTAHAFNR
jgi:uroporphyrinogen decarboxylase